MKSVGEVMAIGRNIHESMQKALRGLETGLSGFNFRSTAVGASRDEIERFGESDARPAAQSRRRRSARGSPSPKSMRCGL
jgi:hypothetical protein